MKTSVKKKRMAIALGLLSVGGLLYAAVRIQIIWKGEGPFFNPYSRVEEKAIILFVLSVLSALLAIWISLKPTPKKIPFGRKFKKYEAVSYSENYYHSKSRFGEKESKMQEGKFHGVSAEKFRKKLPLMLFLYLLGYSFVFYLYRFHGSIASEFFLVDGVLILGILGCLVSAVGFMLKQVYLAWSVGILVSFLQLIWFPYGTIAGAFLLSQLLPEKPPAITLRFRADRWRRRRPQQPLLHVKTDTPVFSRAADKRDGD